jgi:hypothetical protein
MQNYAKCLNVGCHYPDSPDALMLDRIGYKNIDTLFTIMFVKTLSDSV